MGSALIPKLRIPTDDGTYTVTLPVVCSDSHRRKERTSDRAVYKAETSTLATEQRVIIGSRVVDNVYKTLSHIAVDPVYKAPTTKGIQELFKAELLLSLESEDGSVRYDFPFEEKVTYTFAASDYITPEILEQAANYLQALQRTPSGQIGDRLYEVALGRLDLSESAN